MKKSFTKLMRRLYLIRRIDALLGFATLFIGLVLSIKHLEPGVPINFSLILIPILYLANELIMFFIYKKAKKLATSNQLDYFFLNRKQKIACQINQSDLLIGNLNFIDYKPQLVSAKSLILAKVWGMSIAVLIILQFLTMANFFSIFFFALAILVFLIKKIDEGLSEEQVI